MRPEELQARIAKLEDLLRPFAGAYRLHRRDNRRVTSLKAVLVMNTSIDDWKAAYEELFGAQEPVKTGEEVA